jgi:hypothetical protein
MLGLYRYGTRVIPSWTPLRPEICAHFSPSGQKFWVPILWGLESQIRGKTLLPTKLVRGTREIRGQSFGKASMLLFRNVRVDKYFHMIQTSPDL